MLMMKVLFVMLTGLTAGCFSRPSIDLQQTQLMPREVAIGIVTKYSSAGWAKRPTLQKPAGCPEPRVVPIGYGDINHVFYDGMNGRVWISKLGTHALFGCAADVSLQSWIGVANETQAQELANALVSLGANVK
jgi:hypothetical protein